MVSQPLRTGSFPYQHYVARCGCIDGKEEPTLNYAKHPVAPPKCSSCKRPYQLAESLMPTSAAISSSSLKGKE